MRKGEMSGRRRAFAQNHYSYACQLKITRPMINFVHLRKTASNGPICCPTASLLIEQGKYAFANVFYNLYGELVIAIG